MFRFNFEIGFDKPTVSSAQTADTEQSTMHFEPKRWDVFLVDLPEQSVTQCGEHGRLFSVVGTEMHGHHRIVILSVDDDGRYVVGLPMTSATDSRGGNKWSVWRKSWHRAVYEGKVACIQVEQIRYVDRTRLLKQESTLSRALLPV